MDRRQASARRASTASQGVRPPGPVRRTATVSARPVVGPRCQRSPVELAQRSCAGGLRPGAGMRARAAPPREARDTRCVGGLARHRGSTSRRQATRSFWLTGEPKGSPLRPGSGGRWARLRVDRHRRDNRRGRAGRGVGGPAEDLVEALGERLAERREQVAVDVNGERDRPMAEPLLDDLWMSAQADQERRAGMTKIVHAECFG